MGGGSGQGHVTVRTDVVRALGPAIIAAAAPSLQSASSQLDDARDVLHSNFTSVTPALAVAYAAAVEYLDPELKSKASHLDGLSTRLAAVAGGWEETEQKSTVRVQGGHVQNGDR